MDERKDILSQIAKDECESSYRDKIVGMIAEIKDEWFLKRIYISLRDYIGKK